MKDVTHHLKHLQKKVIQEARHQAQINGVDEKHIVEQIQSESSLLAQGSVRDVDNKRKGQADFVRHMPQRERRH